MNNRIYGLTKGQYSPTSARGFVSKSSPYGTVEDPFRPADLCFGARGRFFARCAAVDGGPSVEVLKAAARHKRYVGSGKYCRTVSSSMTVTHNAVAKKEDRERNAIYLEHGKPMLLVEQEFGLMQEGLRAEKW